MHRSIYLVNPKESVPGYDGLEVLGAWGGMRMTNLVDLSTPTVAAMVPVGWDVSICDERAQEIDFDTPATVVGLTGKVSQRSRMIELAAEFRRRGKLVLAGGPHVSLNPADLRGHVDILVKGEIEEIAATLFDDLAGGGWQAEYEGTRPDLRTSPVPRWDLYPGRIGLVAQVQTSRGCPFECEFCDVIQYLGRKQRWKEPDQVIRELELIYAIGYRDVFLADDNFTVVRRRARALVAALADWNAKRPQGRMRFSTQISIDVARDEDLLLGSAAAGLHIAFIGIETPNEASLAEAHKRQNLRVDLAEETAKVVKAGIMVMAGLITGFDHDDTSIFERQAEFVERMPVPLATVGLLVAPFATPLHDRMRKEGRLVEAQEDYLGAGNLFRTNIQPKLMTRRQLESGTFQLMQHIYRPDVFARRLAHFVELSPRRPAPVQPFFGPLESAIARGLAALGDPDDRRLLGLFEKFALQRPELKAQLVYCLLYYAQARYRLSRHAQKEPAYAGMA